MKTKWHVYAKGIYCGSPIASKEQIIKKFPHSEIKQNRVDVYALERRSK